MEQALFLSRSQFTKSASRFFHIYKIYIHIYISVYNIVNKIVNIVIESFRKQELLSKSTAIKLTVDEVTTPQSHILLKVHVSNIPGRPVVSSVKYHTSKISKFIDHFLQPHAKSLSSYIKDTQKNRRYKVRNNSCNLRCQITL